MARCKPRTSRHAADRSAGSGSQSRLQGFHARDGGRGRLSSAPKSRARLPTCSRAGSTGRDARGDPRCHLPNEHSRRIRRSAIANELRIDFGTSAASEQFRVGRDVELEHGSRTRSRRDQQRSDRHRQDRARGFDQFPDCCTRLADLEQERQRTEQTDVGQGRQATFMAAWTMDPDHHLEPPDDLEQSSARSSPSARDEAATWFARGLGFVGGGLLAYGIVNGFIGASSVVLLFFVALLLASALEPLVVLLRNRLPVARGAALLFVYAAFFAIVVVMVLLVIPGALNQVGELVRRAAGRPPARQGRRASSLSRRPAQRASARSSTPPSRRSSRVPPRLPARSSRRAWRSRMSSPRRPRSSRSSTSG